MYVAYHAENRHGHKVESNKLEKGKRRSQRTNKAKKSSKIENRSLSKNNKSLCTRFVRLEEEIFSKSFTLNELDIRRETAI
jgi:hypothetical protein